MTDRKSNEQKDVKGIFLRLCGYIARYWYLFVPAILFTLVSNELALLGPKYSGEAIDAIARKGGVDFAVVRSSAAHMLLCYAIAAVLSYVLTLLMSLMSQKISYLMRKQLFEKLTSLPVGYFDKHPTGDIISHISYDIDTVNATLSHDLLQIMTSIYTVVGSLIFMWRISPPLLLVFAVTVPIAVFFASFRSKRIRPLSRIRTRKLGELNGYAEEMLSGCRSIQAYHREEEIGKRFHVRNEDSMNSYYKWDHLAVTIGPIVNCISNLSISLIMIMGGILYMLSQNGTVRTASLFFISLGGVAQFVQYSRKFSGPINEFANIISELQSAFSAADRVFRILDEEPENRDAEDAAELTDTKGEIVFDDVSFGYTKEKTILKNISFTAKSGQTIAFVGPTGAGKTTLISLLMRFYDPDCGTVSVDGKPFLSLTRASLRKAYTMVLQDTWLFGGTVYENIAYGCEGATREMVEAAAKAARVDQFIDTLPDGYDTMLNDSGVNISKGQKQLITIARAMLSDSKMLIFDEATSNVDSRTESKVQAAMNDLMQGRTCFTIAHRLSTIQNADCIYVMQHGEITEYGTHEELLRLGGFYSTLYRSQFH